jgi:hypothetical protein
METMSGWVWFILGAAWIVGIWVAWTFMKASGSKADHMSAEWLEKRRREERGER